MLYEWFLILVADEHASAITNGLPFTNAVAQVRFLTVKGSKKAPGKCREACVVCLTWKLASCLAWRDVLARVPGRPCLNVLPRFFQCGSFVAEDTTVQQRQGRVDLPPGHLRSTRLKTLTLRAIALLDVLPAKASRQTLVVEDGDGSGTHGLAPAPARPRHTKRNSRSRSLLVQSVLEAFGKVA